METPCSSARRPALPSATSSTSRRATRCRRPPFATYRCSPNGLSRRYAPQCWTAGSRWTPGRDLRGPVRQPPGRAQAVLGPRTPSPRRASDQVSRPRCLLRRSSRAGRRMAVPPGRGRPRTRPDGERRIRLPRRAQVGTHDLHSPGVLPFDAQWRGVGGLGGDAPCDVVATHVGTGEVAVVGSGVPVGAAARALHTVQGAKSLQDVAAAIATEVHRPDAVHGRRCPSRWPVESAIGVGAMSQTVPTPRPQRSFGDEAQQ